MKYKTFLFTFLLSVVTGIVFFVFYIKAIFFFARSASYGEHIEPFSMFDRIFTPEIIISFIVMLAASLAYRIMAIVWVAKNNIISGGEKALWIIGFIIFGFVTAIVFLVLAKSRKLIEQETETG
jgi:hypothetical protein